MTTTLNWIEEAAEEVLKANEVDCLPVDPFKIAREEGIKLAPGDYCGRFDGRIECRARRGGRQFYLFYAPESAPLRPEGRVRFSVAHELGHYFLPEHREFLLDGKWHGSEADFVSDKVTEREADQFAASLLMPGEHFSNAVSALTQSVCTMSELMEMASNTFCTSVTSTVIRYVEMDFEPCCVFVSKGGQIRYKVPSDSMRNLGLVWIQTKSKVPHGSKTAELLAKGDSGMDGAIPADVWFRDRGRCLLWEDARVLGRPGFVLTLLSLHQDDNGDGF